MTTEALPIPQRAGLRGALPSLRPRSPERAVALAQLGAFAAVSSLVAWRWLDLVARPPSGRGVLVVALILAGAAALAAGTEPGRRRRLRLGFGIAIAIAATIGALVAIGLPARLLAPAHWGELGHGVRIGLDGTFGGDYPYLGSQPWVRLVILAGLPLALGVAAILAFVAPGSRRLRGFGLLVLLAAWGTATALSAPKHPVTTGLALFLAVSAWLWLGRARGTAVVPAGVLLAAASLIAMPVAVALDRGRPVLDYSNWDLGLSSAEARSVSYTWDQTYGPLNWPRNGRSLFTVTGSSPQYWRATTLDRFDGIRWVTANEPGAEHFALPAIAEHATTFSGQIAALDPSWVHTATFDVDHLSSNLAIAPGAILRWRGLPGATATATGLLLPTPDTLGSGASYSVVAYEPDPTPDALRQAPGRLAPGLRRFTEIGLPEITESTIPTDRLGHAIQLGRKPRRGVTVRTIEMPLYRGAGRARARAYRRALAQSAYADVAALARQLAAGTGTEYGAVRAIEGYLRTRYTYSESPPKRKLPLRAFLLRDRRGYCQQFSGAMALMLRSLGIPARIASGFSPGIPNPDGNGFEVRDLDAHSWVEVYFTGIGWVPFDPTPAAAPASSQLARPAGFIFHRGASRQLANQPTGPTSEVAGGFRATHADSGPAAWPWALAVLALATAGAAAGAVRRRARFRALPPAAATAIQARELGSLAARLGLEGRRGITLLELERRLRTIAGPAAGAYAGTLRAARYESTGADPPTLRERRVLRRALFAGSGLRRRLAGLVAMPPGAPR